jgi:hypothetical protein
LLYGSQKFKSYSAKHSRLFEEICGRLGEGGRGFLAELDFAAEALAACGVDNACIQGFAGGMIFMGLFKKLQIILKTTKSVKTPQEHKF